METQLLSLIDYLAHTTQCDYISDLHFMNRIRKWKAYRALRKIPAEAYPLKDWSDALCYMTRRTPQTSAAKARTELLAFLAA